MIVEYDPNDEMHGNVLRIVAADAMELAKLRNFCSGNGLRLGNSIRFKYCADKSELSLIPDCPPEPNGYPLLVKITDAESGIAVLELINKLLVVKGPRPFDREYKQLSFLGCFDETEATLEFAHD